MKAMIAAVMAVALAACSQTSDTQTASADLRPKTAAQQKKVGAAGDKCDTAIRNQANTAALGSVLGMAGGLGGFGGRGGAAAGYIASTAGSAIAQHQAASARNAVHRDCLARAG